MSQLPRKLEEMNQNRSIRPLSESMASSLASKIPPQQDLLFFENETKKKMPSIKRKSEEQQDESPSQIDQSIVEGMASASIQDYNEDGIDFISELHAKNCQHIIDNILENLSPIVILKASTVSEAWRFIVKESKKYPHDFAQLFEKYHANNPSMSKEDLLGKQTLSFLKS